jgi:hypothetical protein
LAIVTARSAVLAIVDQAGFTAVVVVVVAVGKPRDARALRLAARDAVVELAIR